MKLYQGDCLDVMNDIPDGSIDMVLCDLPYGNTKNKWDSVIPVNELWSQYHRVVKKGGAVVLFSQMPFSAMLVMSNVNEFRYEWIWNKTYTTGFLDANRRPMRSHEIILVFSDALPEYHPQGLRKVNASDKQLSGSRSSNYSNDYGTKKNGGYELDKEGYVNYPRDVISFGKDSDIVHPTQKPVSLCEYLIRTHSEEGETVLDNCMGSGTTGVACVHTGRDFTGIEKSPEYFSIAKDRIGKAEYKVRKTGRLEDFI